MPLLEPAPEVHSPGERVLAAQESGSAPWAPELEGPGNTHTHTPTCVCPHSTRASFMLMPGDAQGERVRPPWRESGREAGSRVPPLGPFLV